MADVSISYKGSEIASMNATGVKTLLTSSAFCEDDITVTYTKPAAPVPSLQTKSATYTPSTSQQTASITADAGYDALGEVNVTVNAMPSGSAATPATTITANPSISVSSGGLITASVSASQSVTPTVSAGYVSSGTAGTVSVSGSNTSQLTTQAAQTIHPSTTDHTIASGKYLTGAQTVKGVLLTNLSAGNIKKDVVVKVGDSTDDDCVASVTGTYEGGGGSTPVPQKQINFIDYDGTLLHSYTKTEINAMTSESDLPANPSHTGLTAQGWNWTLTQIKAQLTAVPDGEVWVGQMYTTASGKTEIDVRMPSGRLSPILTIAVNGTVSIDWGDNTTPDTVTGSSLTTSLGPSHTYASAGDYTISISVTSGSFAFYGTSAQQLLRKNTTTNENKVYANCVRAIRIGSGLKSVGQYTLCELGSLSSITIPSGLTSIGSNLCVDCYSLKSITLPSGITGIGNYEYNNCYSLSSISIPSSVTNIGGYSFTNCYALSGITIPNGVTSIGTYAFSGCANLKSIAIPSTVTSIGTFAFNYCYSLSSITIPSGVTSIANNTFTNCYALSSIAIPNGVTSIGNSVLSGCQALSSISIPSTVTRIGNTAFQNCYGAKEYHILPTNVPTGGTNMFRNIPSDCIIYVPASKLSDYKGASNWSTYASYMQGE